MLQKMCKLTQLVHCSYSTIAWVASLDKGVQPRIDYNIGYKETTQAGTVLSFFNRLGAMAFAYAGHNVVYAIPVFDMIETLLVKKMNFKPTFMLRFITRITYMLVTFTMMFAICVPFFGGLLGFFGGFAFAPTTYFIPYACWLIIHKPKIGSLSWIINWVCNQTK
ncbi:putative amino acid transporter, transmembrane domain-containing protein [Helianthus annuus]|nr:putative amino acid transporter, transmembrane domain-containing protein [Helianthus annuus]